MPKRDGNGPMQSGELTAENQNYGCRRQGGHGRGLGYGRGMGQGKGRQGSLNTGCAQGMRQGPCKTKNSINN